jgi:alpha-beta hydrolase superfamily lysophospholipase
MSVALGTILTSDGFPLVTRHWEAPDPRATLVIVHGIGEHSGRWDHVGEYFSGAGYDTHSFDLRGHGESGGVAHHVDEFAELVDDVEVIVDHVRVGERPLVVYGHSLGGLIVTAYAVSTRPQADLYVTSAPALSANAPAPLKIAARILGRVLPTTRLGTPIAGEQLSRDPRIGESYFADPHVSTKATAGLGAALLNAMDETRAQIDRIRVPMLVVHGADDTLVPPAASAPLAANPMVERKLFPGLRHEIHNEPEQDQVLDTIREWLDARLGGN